jgi:cAMP phosphodiesterase
VRIKLLPSSFDIDGRILPAQRLTSYVLDNVLAVDAGSLALGMSDFQRQHLRDIVITHSHIDHIATLPVLIDELFGSLEAPLRIHATPEVIELLERDIFNDMTYPRLSKLSNSHGPVIRYCPLPLGKPVRITHFQITAVAVNHPVPTVGLRVSDTHSTVIFGSDSAETDDIWALANQSPNLKAVLVEASYPNHLEALARDSGHLTPASLKTELKKLQVKNLHILAVGLKPSYRETIAEELAALGDARIRVMDPGKEYLF